MPAHRAFEELQARLSELLEASPAKDIERNAKALMASTFSRLNLVTREEFDLQAKLLARMQERLAALEARVAALEARLSKDVVPPASTNAPPDV